MTTANVLQVLFLILGAMLVFQAYWLAGTALFPRLVGSAKDRYKRPFRTTLIGLLVVVPAIWLGFMLLGQASQPVFKGIGFVVGSLPLIAGMIGSAGLCQLIGLGLPAPLLRLKPRLRISNQRKIEESLQSLQSPQLQLWPQKQLRPR